MRPAIRSDHPIRGLFSGLVENAFFTELGFCEPRLTTYLCDLMVDFLHVDRLDVLRSAFGRSLEQMAAILALKHDVAPLSLEQRDRLMYRHIGDFALFWTGIFPEHLRSRRSGDLLCAYVEQGKRSYAACARLSQDLDVPPPTLLNSLSEEFETCVHGLGLVRRSWQHAGGAEGAGRKDILL